MRPAVFLDRDGTVIEERGYLDRLESVVPFSWSAPAIAALRSAGYAIVVVTNQAGVARGYFDEPFVRSANDRLDALLRARGALVDGYYYCPHHPDGAIDAYRRVCECRKPAPGLVHRAARDLQIDVARSFVIGDKWLDVELAQNAGAAGILVRTGYGARVEHDQPRHLRVAAIVDDLGAAARWILGDSARV